MKLTCNINVRHLTRVEGHGNIRIVIKDGVVYDPEMLLRSAEGKIGPVGPHDHANWELEVRPLREN